MAMAHQVHTYTELRQQIHNDLRVQHPEWVQPNGESPICDSYEVRLMELLADLEEIQAHGTPAVPAHEGKLRFRDGIVIRSPDFLPVCALFGRVAVKKN